MIFDVGANVGATALRYRELFPEGTIHCFEPYPESFAQLRAALSSDKRVFLHELALSSAAGRAILRVNRSAETNSLLASDRRGERYWGVGLLETDSEIEVEVQSVDLFCARHGIARLDILKLDVQGAEYSVLEGASGLLAAQRIDLVYTEVIMAPTYLGQRQLLDYLALFSAKRYQLFDLYNPTRKNGRLIQADVIFVSDALLERYETEHGGAD
jgi:FkbM family methyltransferase